MARIRYNNALGTLGGAGLTAGGTTIDFGATPPPFATLAAGDYIPLVLEPPTQAPSANFEVVYLTAYTAGQTTGTISRAQEGTTGVSHTAGVTWVCGPTAADETNRAITTKAFTLATAVETGSTITGPGRACMLYQFQADQPCRFRLYATQAAALADLSRSQTVDPSGNHGCLLEVVITQAGGQTLLLSPEVLMHELDTSGGSTFYCNARCDNGTVLNVTLSGLVLMP